MNSNKVSKFKLKKQIFEEKKVDFLQTPKKADPTNFCLIVVEIKCSQLAVNFRNVSLLII